MDNDKKTVAEIVKRVRRECNSYPLPNAAGEKLKLVREIDDAHKREIGELKGERKGLLKANEAFAADNTRLRGEVAAKDAEIEKLKAALKTCVDYIKCEYGCGSECDAACEEIESGCKLREWTIEFGLETLGRKGGE